MEFKSPYLGILTPVLQIIPWRFDFTGLAKALPESQLEGITAPSYLLFHSNQVSFLNLHHPKGNDKVYPILYFHLVSFFVIYCVFKGCLVKNPTEIF